LYYYIYWGDQTFDYWTGPFESSVVVTFNHTYNKSGSFTITSKAQDVLLGVNQQIQFNINILKNRALANPLKLRVL